MNVYRQIAQRELQNPKGNEVSGTFFCQEQGCDSATNEARYLPELKVLTWKPDCGHIGTIEGYTL